MEFQEESGRWLQQRILGAGAFGIVQLWKNDYTNEMIAVKRCKDGIHLSEKQRERWVKEVQNMNFLCHPNVVATRGLPVQLCNLHDKLQVLCMEYCSGGDLRRVLNKTSNCCGIEESDALRIMQHIASAVEYLHSLKITHRDLKPENIVLQRIQEKVIYKLTDLGYARELGQMSVDASIVGTLNYIAPEMFCNPTYTCSVDYWGLGILFYEVVTGNRPFLPDMPFSPAWVELVKNKTDMDICAHMKDGAISFSTEIEIPSTISGCMRSPLTSWFRLALQWDPKKRGKIINAQSCDELVLFTNLKSILSYKILYVFDMSHYRYDSYAVDPRISVQQLQARIHVKTGIKVSDQIISDFDGNIFSEPSTPLSNFAMNPNLIVFDKKCLRVTTPPKVNMSPLLDRILKEPRAFLDYETAKRCNGALLYFIKQEHKIFRSYVVALSVKIDLGNAALNNLREIVKNLKTQASDFMSEIMKFLQSSECLLMNNALKCSLDTTRDKTKNLLVRTEEVISKINGLKKDFDNLTTISNHDWLESWRTLDADATNLLEASPKVNHGQHSSPVQMSKLLYRALRLYTEQLHCPRIETVLSRIEEFDLNIGQLQVSLNSFEALVVAYRKTYEEIMQQRAMEEYNSCFDTVLYDNTFLCNLIESVASVFPSIENMENSEFH